jgi:AAA family ATP:ADP antiporter
MGAVFSAIIGSYWTLGTVKEALISTLVGSAMLPYAKATSLICLVPMLMIYSRLLDYLSRERLFYMLSIGYTVVTFLFALLVMNHYIGEADAAVIAARTGWAAWGTQFLGYAYYAVVESYGSLMVALFWSIAVDTTQPESAKKGFSLVVALGQLGGIVSPILISKIPRYFGFQTCGLSIMSCAFLLMSALFLLRYFLATTPKHFLQSFHGVNEEQVAEKQEPGFFEGLKLLMQHRYLLCIFSMMFFFEMLTQIFDFHFKCMAAEKFCGLALMEYISTYSSMVSAMTLLCLVLGINRITRFFGLGVSLALMPIILGCAIFGFVTVHHLTFLFWLMVGSKAFNYALNVPAVKQLYIPTTHDVRFKAQAWIETFGSRSARQGGGFYNMLLKPLQLSMGAHAGQMYHILMTAYFGFAFVIVWFFIALYLGKTCKKAVDTRTVVC